MLRHWQLFAAGGWAFLAVVILLRSFLFDAETVDRFPVRNWTVANVLCGFFALWNLARWYQVNAGRENLDRGQLPLRPNPDAKPGYEYNPDFDFQKQDADKKSNE